MAPKVLIEFEDKNTTFQIATIEQERLPEALEIISLAFVPQENICRGCEMASNPRAANELVQLAAASAKDNVSLIAIEKETNKIVGASFNKLQKQSKSNEKSFFEKFRDDQCKELNSTALINFMIDLDSVVNLFDEYKVDSAIEIMFMAVLPEYSNRKIGSMLVNCTLDFAKTLPVEERPKIATSLITSIFTYKIFKKYNFTDIFRKEFCDYTYYGKWKFSDKVDTNLHDMGLVLMARRIE